MKSLLHLCFLLGVFTLVWAEVNDKLTPASDKSSDSKPKRDASLVGGSYHGPSYKYLPPSGGASSYDSYASAHHGLASSGFGGGYSSSGLGHSSGFAGGYSGAGHHGLSSIGHHGVSSVGLPSGYSGHSLGHHSSGHSLGHHSSDHSLGHHSSGHHGISSSGLGYGSSGHYSGHGLAHHSVGGIKGGSHGFSGSPSYSVSSLGHGGYSGSPSYTSGHNSFASSGSGSGSSGLGYKTHAVSGPSYVLSAGHSGSLGGSSGGGYHYTKGSSGSLPSGLGTVGSFAGSHGLGSAVSHHSVDQSDHIHNGEQEHHYVINSGHSAGFGGAHGAVSSSSSLGHQAGYHYESPVQQHPLPSSSYGVPIATVGDSYSTNYHSQSAGQELGPIYAAGHKGLGHFGFTANKPQVLHTSIGSSSSSFKQPSYSKAPFKPSAFLGSKYEGSAHSEASSGAEATGYDYAIPSGSSDQYQESHYANNGETQATPIYEPESTYLPANNNEASYNEISSNPSESYLTPGQSYGVPYKH